MDPALQPARDPHHGDSRGRGFQAIQRGVASSTEGSAARLTPKGLDRFGLAMFAIAHQRVPVHVSVAEVPAVPVRAGEPFGGDASGGLLGDFSLQTRGGQALALHPTRQWGRDDRPGNRLASGASRDVGAWCAPGLLLSTGQDHERASKGHRAAREST
jgi:hypothetical protein